MPLSAELNKPAVGKVKRWQLGAGVAAGIILLAYLRKRSAAKANQGQQIAPFLAPQQSGIDLGQTPFGDMGGGGGLGGASGGGSTSGGTSGSGSSTGGTGSTGTGPTSGDGSGSAGGGALPVSLTTPVNAMRSVPVNPAEQTFANTNPSKVFVNPYNGFVGYNTEGSTSTQPIPYGQAGAGYVPGVAYDITSAYGQNTLRPQPGSTGVPGTSTFSGIYSIDPLHPNY